MQDIVWLYKVYRCNVSIYVYIYIYPYTIYRITVHLYPPRCSFRRFHKRMCFKKRSLSSWVVCQLGRSEGFRRGPGGLRSETVRGGRSPKRWPEKSIGLAIGGEHKVFGFQKLPSENLVFFSFFKRKTLNRPYINVIFANNDTGHPMKNLSLFPSADSTPPFLCLGEQRICSRRSSPKSIKKAYRLSISPRLEDRVLTADRNQKLFKNPKKTQLPQSLVWKPHRFGVQRSPLGVPDPFSFKASRAKSRSDKTSWAEGKTIHQHRVFIGGFF